VHKHTLHTLHTLHTHTTQREEPKSQVLRFSEREREMIERGGQGRQRERHDDTGLCREKGQVWEDTDRADLRPRTIIRLIRVRCCTVRALPQRGGKREGRGRVKSNSLRLHTHTRREMEGGDDAMRQTSVRRESEGGEP
jgi:hypothetical protein